MAFFFFLLFYLLFQANVALSLQVPTPITTMKISSKRVSYLAVSGNAF